MNNVKVIGYGYYQGGHTPAVTMTCTTSKRNSEMKIRQVVSKKMREYDSNIVRVDIAIDR